ncbi:hypothetical protein E5Q_05133 [Mixia osmundae IAM 14324]|uniref:Transcription factor domain-containing protein n=2 Tax=Mixia osmundae (strain CBS 9802 / IAM 14324 / JCM 22182 / KY 12970) TaxID=764103 RepID=G7E6I7_MIXOS|nr:hypothetical protein E5Q_05133 [Mixia osmundae IAM 14324]
MGRPRAQNASASTSGTNTHQRISATRQPTRIGSIHVAPQRPTQRSFSSPRAYDGSFFDVASQSRHWLGLENDAWQSFAPASFQQLHHDYSALAQPHQSALLSHDYHPVAHQLQPIAQQLQPSPRAPAALPVLPKRPSSAVFPCLAELIQPQDLKYSYDKASSAQGRLSSLAVYDRLPLTPSSYERGSITHDRGPSAGQNGIFGTGMDRAMLDTSLNQRILPLPSRSTPNHGFHRYSAGLGLTGGATSCSNHNSLSAFGLERPSSGFDRPASNFEKPIGSGLAALMPTDLPPILKINNEIMHDASPAPARLCLSTNDASTAFAEKRPSDRSAAPSPTRKIPRLNEALETLSDAERNALADAKLHISAPSAEVVATFAGLLQCVTTCDLDKAHLKLIKDRYSAALAFVPFETRLQFDEQETQRYSRKSTTSVLWQCLAVDTLSLQIAGRTSSSAGFGMLLERQGWLARLLAYDLSPSVSIISARLQYAGSKQPLEDVPQQTIVELVKIWLATNAMCIVVNEQELLAQVSDGTVDAALINVIVAHSLSNLGQDSKWHDSLPPISELIHYFERTCFERLVKTKTFDLSTVQALMIGGTLALLTHKIRIAWLGFNLARHYARRCLADVTDVPVYVSGPPTINQVHRELLQTCIWLTNAYSMHCSVSLATPHLPLDRFDVDLQLPPYPADSLSLAYSRQIAVKDPGKACLAPEAKEANLVGFAELCRVVYILTRAHQGDVACSTSLDSRNLTPIERHIELAGCLINKGLVLLGCTDGKQSSLDSGRDRAFGFDKGVPNICGFLSSTCAVLGFQRASTHFAASTNEELASSPVVAYALRVSMTAIAIVNAASLEPLQALAETELLTAENGQLGILRIVSDVLPKFLSHMDSVVSAIFIMPQEVYRHIFAQHDRVRQLLNGLHTFVSVALSPKAVEQIAELRRIGQHVMELWSASFPVRPSKGDAAECSTPPSPVSRALPMTLPSSAAPYPWEPMPQFTSVVTAHGPAGDESSNHLSVPRDEAQEDDDASLYSGGSAAGQPVRFHPFLDLVHQAHCELDMPSISRKASSAVSCQALAKQACPTEVRWDAQSLAPIVVPKLV